MRLRACALASAAIVPIILGAPALAQDTPDTASSSSAQAEATAATEEGYGLEEITVTAQRRSERLQDVPIAVTALTSGALDNQGITSVEDLQLAVPGLVFSTSLNSALPYLRGVGSPDSSAGAESSIATYVDGIYYPALPGTIFSLDNIERIEVLKGPQGTLFGRNATGGLVQVITKDPPSELSGRVKLGYANYDTVEGSVYIGTGIAPNLAVDFAAFVSEQGDAWGYNPVVGQPAFDTDEVQLRSKLVFDDGSTSAKLSLDYSHRSADGGGTLTFLEGARGRGGVTSIGPYNPQGTQPQDGFVEQYGAALSLQHDFGSVRVTSLTGGRRVKSFLSGDQDSVPALFVSFATRQYDHNVTQELQLASSAPGPLQWITGLFYMNREAGTNPSFVVNTRSVTGFQRTRSLGVFGEGSYEFLPQTKLTLGARYSNDRQSVDVTLTPFVGTPFRQNEAVTYEKVTFRAVVDTKPSDDLLLYASFNRGFKAGLFNIGTPSAINRPVRPEVLDAVEAGFKWDIGGRARLNVSAFRYYYSDIQLQQVTDVATLVLNAAKARMTGIEFETMYSPVPGLSLSAGGVYMPEAKYLLFPNAPFSVNAPAGGNIVTRADASGNRLIRAPKLTLNLAAGYETDIGDDTLAFNVSYSHNSGFPWEPDNRLRQKSYDIFNANVSYTLNGPQVTLRGWVKNLTDQLYYVQVSESAFGDRGRPAAPRTYGISIEKKF